MLNSRVLMSKTLVITSKSKESSVPSRYQKVCYGKTNNPVNSPIIVPESIPVTLAKMESPETKLLGLITSTFKRVGKDIFKFSGPHGYRKILEYLMNKNREFNPAFALDQAFRKTNQGTVLHLNQQAIQDTANKIYQEHFQSIAKTNTVGVIERLVKERVAKKVDRVTDNDALLFGEMHSSFATKEGKLINPATDWLIANIPNLWNQGYRNLVFELPQDIEVEDFAKNPVANFYSKSLEFIEAVQILRDKLEKEVRKHNLADDPIADILFSRVDEYLIEARAKHLEAKNIQRSNRQVVDNTFFRWQKILNAAKNQGFQISFGDVKSRTRLERLVLEYPFLDILKQLKQNPRLTQDSKGLKFLEFFLNDKYTRLNQLRDISLASTIRERVKADKTIALLGSAHTVDMPLAGHYSTTQILNQGSFSLSEKKEPIPVTVVKLEFAEENNLSKANLRFLEEFHHLSDIKYPTIFLTNDSPLLSKRTWNSMQTFKRKPGEAKYELVPSKLGDAICNAVVTFPKIQAT